jgi:chromosome partitioning protein
MPPVDDPPWCRPRESRAERQITALERLQATRRQRPVHGVDVIPAAGELAGVEMSLVGELGGERFLQDALDTVMDDYDEVVIDTAPSLGLLTVNALVCSDCLLAPASVEDEGAMHGILELRGTITKLAKRIGGEPPRLIALVTRWSPTRISSRTVEAKLA